MYIDNHWYSHSRIFAEYCGRPGEPPIFGAVRHGWAAFLDDGWGERRLTFVPLFVWNGADLAQARERGLPNVHCVGSPFAYLMRMRYPDEPPPLGVGTLVFPSHSGDGDNSIFNAHEFIEHVVATCEAPYTVSLFHQEVDSDHARIYRDAGWRTISFGSRSNPTFLSELVTEMVNHAAVVGNHLQTALWYAAALGRPIRVVPPYPTYTLRRQEDFDEFARDKWPRLQLEGLSGPDAVAEAHEQLGFDFVRDPAELAQALGWSNPAKRLFAAAYAPLAHYRSGLSAESM